MHAYTWYLWKTQRTGPSLKIRVGKDELMAFLRSSELAKRALRFTRTAYNGRVEAGRPLKAISLPW